MTSNAAADAVNTQAVNEDPSQNQGAQRLVVKRVPETDSQNATYQFVNEDHTLGNLLRN